MEPFDFMSPEAETLVLSRFPCPALCSLARAVVIDRLTVSGMETLLVEYALCTECVANEALSAHAATGPCRGDDGPFPVSLARGAR